MDSSITMDTKSYTAKQVVTINNVMDHINLNKELKLPRFRSREDPSPVFWQLKLQPIWSYSIMGADRTLGGFGMAIATFYCEDPAEDTPDADANALPPRIIKKVDVQNSAFDEFVDTPPDKIQLRLNQWQKLGRVLDEDLFREVEVVPSQWNQLNPKSLNVECSIEYVGGFVVDKSPFISPTPKMDSSLAENYMSLLESGDMADFIFEVGQKEVRAHKVILLARSEHFKRMFQSGMSEARDNRMIMTDIGLETLKQMLGFIYSGQIPADLSYYQAKALVPHADKYGLDLLKRACAEIMALTITDTTYADLLDMLCLAGLHHCRELEDVCLVEVKKHLRVLVEEENWREVKRLTDMFEFLAE